MPGRAVRRLSVAMVRRYLNARITGKCNNATIGHITPKPRLFGWLTLTKSEAVNSKEFRLLFEFRLGKSDDVGILFRSIQEFQCSLLH